MLISSKLLTFWRWLFFPGTLIRETGTEHVLKEHHGGWKTQDLTDNRAREEEARQKAANINHGYVKINENAVHHKEEKFTGAELAEHFQRRKAEDEANIRAADELVARLQVCVNKRQRESILARDRRSLHAGTAVAQQHLVFGEKRFDHMVCIRAGSRRQRTSQEKCRLRKK
jgi:hypothetical protein